MIDNVGCTDEDDNDEEDDDNARTIVEDDVEGIIEEFAGNNFPMNNFLRYEAEEEELE